MMSIRALLLIIICGSGILFALLWLRNVQRNNAHSSGATRLPTFAQLAVGFVTNFFDTLGIGSFATTTAAYKMFKLVPDELIPGTMLVGHSLPVAAQALIFISLIQVDATLLLSLIAITIVGGWLGAGIVTKLPRRAIQIGMGTALLVAATFMAMTQLGLFPGGGTALALPPVRFALAMAGSFMIGAVLMLGIGNYAPTLILLSVLGMDPRAAFPIMMGAGAMVGMVGGLRFMNRGRFDARAALGLTLGGIPAVLVAGLLVKSLPLEVLRWIVVCVVVYAGVEMLRSFARPTPQAQPG